MSMSFYAAKTNADQSEPVFSMDEITDGTWREEGNEEVFVPNPGYIPEADVTLSNANAYDVLSALGYHVEDGFWCAPAAEVAARCSNWLQQNINQPRGYMDVFIDTKPGQATMIQCGRDASYLNRTIERIGKLARLGIERGADEIYAC